MSKFITSIDQAADTLAANGLQLITFNHNISLDGGLAQMYFEDFTSGDAGFEVQTFGNRQTDFMVVYDDGLKHAKHYKPSQVNKLKKADLTDLCDGLGISYYDEDTRADLIGYLLRLDNEDYYAAYYDNSTFYDLDCDLDITGYSQGDRVKIILVGNEVQSLTDEGMTNLFFDCPISGSIAVYINGDHVNELYVSEFLPSAYDYWDKADFIECVSDYIGQFDYGPLLLEYLADNLPTDLDYI